MFEGLKHKKKQTVEVTVSNRTIFRIVLLVVISYLFLIALHKASHAIILILTAVFLAFALNAPVYWLGKNIPGKLKGNRTLATLLSFIVVVALLVAFIISIGPPLVRQTDSFIHAAPGLVGEVHNQNTALGHFVRKYHLENQVSTFSSQLGSRLSKLSGSAFTTVTKVTSSIFSLLIVLALTFMMLIEGPRWIDIFKRLLPDELQKRSDYLGTEMYKVIKGYVNGQVLLAVIAAVAIVIPLFIFHISYPVALMVVVFLCALIPMVGHTIGAAIVTLVALFHSPIAALIILAYYIFYMQVEAYIIQPKIQANTTNMSPLLVFSAVVIGVTFDGLLGGLVAIPVAGCIRIIVLDFVDRHDLLDDPAKAETK